ncbi:MAG: DUF4974 domain-containing protein [Prevotella sp.]|nr:DUF4974 domain-containing protein [Prevotella sp.]
MNNNDDNKTLNEALRSIEREEDFRLSDGFEQRVMSCIARTRRSQHYRIAAAVIAVLMASGIALGAYLLATKSGSSTQETTLQQTSVRQAAGEAATDGSAMVVRFQDVRLDSILQVVGRYYNNKVEYRTDSMRSLHLLVEWDKRQPLDDFLRLLNNFEGISVKQQDHTIVVE